MFARPGIDFDVHGQGEARDFGVQRLVFVCTPNFVHRAQYYLVHGFSRLRILERFDLSERNPVRFLRVFLRSASFVLL